MQAPQSPSNPKPISQLPPTVLDEAPVTEGPGSMIGRYKLLESLGEGGFGIVWLAAQKEPVERNVALKVIKLGMDTRQVIARFEAERQALALMDHPNIAKVFDAGATDTGRPFFVMELVKGIPITHYCDQQKLNARSRLELFIKVCEAVQHAHQKGIIHRDIKPSNILVTLQENDPVPKVIDFGIAKATQQKLTDKTLHTQLQQFIGTPAYMSPEQAEMSGMDIDTRSDIYSLGVLLYELLIGKTPFDTNELLKGGLDEIRRTIREKEPVRPSTRLSTMANEDLTATTQRRAVEAPKLLSLLRGDLDWIVMKCLEKDRTRRYETANGLAADLKRHLNNEPVVARPPSAAYRLQKAWRRHRLAFTAASVMAVSMLTGITVSTWKTIEASKARNDEIKQRLAAQDAQRAAETAREAEKQQRLRADAEKVAAQLNLYVANLNLAQQMWEQNNVGRLRDLLDETQTFPDRGFEWYYWQKQTHLALLTLQGHLSTVMSVAFSPNGQWILTGSGDGTAQLWEAATGQELLRLKGHTGGVSSVVFSPDGRRILTGSFDRTAKCWDAATGKELFSLAGHAGMIRTVAFSADGARVATAGDDHTAKIWDTADRREVITVTNESPVSSVAFSPDGQRLLTGTWKYVARVWDTGSGRELFTLNGHTRAISSVAYSVDGLLIVTGSDDQTAKVWRAADGQELRTLGAQSSAVWSVAFSRDGQRILTGCDDQTVNIWETATGRKMLTFKGHGASVRSAVFSPDARRVLSGSDDQTARIWDATNEREPPNLKRHHHTVWSAVFSPDGLHIATGCEDGKARLWNLDSPTPEFTLQGHSNTVFSVAFSPDGQRLVTASQDLTLKVWDTVLDKELFSLNGHTRGVWSVAYAPDGQRIVSGSVDGTAKVWQAATGRELRTLRGHTDSVLTVAFSSDGQRILTGSSDKTAKVWDVSEGRELLTLRGHSLAIRSVNFSRDGTRIVTAGDDGMAKVWDARTGQELMTLIGHRAAIETASFSPDGRRIATAGDDHRLRIWEALTGRELLSLEGHGDVIYSANFSPDGRQIVTGSADQTARVWEAATESQVSSWQRQEKVATERIAALRRDADLEQKNQQSELARDAGAIKSWLILAPIPWKRGQSGAEALDAEQISFELPSLPKAGDTCSDQNRELLWQSRISDDYVIDFNAFVGRRTDASTAYAVCYILSEREQRDLQLLVGSDDETSVTLNGNLIYKHPFGRGFVADQDKVRGVVLNAGRNVLVFKVVNEFADWKGSVRFTDAEGKSLQGIRVLLDPQKTSWP